MNLFHRYKMIFIIDFIFLLIVGILSGRNLYQSKHSLHCTTYRIQTDKIQKAIRVVQITDLHNSVFGEKNAELIDLVSEQSPDLIIITGDLLNSNETKTDIAVEVMVDLCQIAPVYVSIHIFCTEKHIVDRRRNSLVFFQGIVDRVFAGHSIKRADVFFCDLDVGQLGILFGQIFQRLLSVGNGRLFVFCFCLLFVNFFEQVF